MTRSSIPPVCSALAVVGRRRRPAGRSFIAGVRRLRGREAGCGDRPCARSSTNALVHGSQRRRRPRTRSTSTLILISLVVIIWMLMPAVGQGLEHRGGDAGVGAHPQADDRDLGDLGVVRDARGADRLGGGLGGAQGLGQVARGDGEADLGRPRRSRRSGRSCRPRCSRAAIVRKIAWTTPGRSGTPQDRDPGLVLGQRRAGDGDAQPAGVALADDPGARGVGERAADVDRHAVLLGELDRPRVHHARPQAGQLEHLVVADPVDLAALRGRSRGSVV